MFNEGGWGSGGGKNKILPKDKGWRAWFNAQPSTNGSLSTLHVLGCLDVGNKSDGIQLTYAGLEQSNPPNLLLKVTLQTIFVPRGQGDTTVRLHYSQDISVGQIGSIKIFYPDNSFTEIDFIPIVY